VSYTPIPTQRRSIESRIVRRAWADPDYKRRLLADPYSAVGEELGIELPPGLEVRVVEERPNSLCIVLPVDLSPIPLATVRVMVGVAPQPQPPASSEGVEGGADDR
jgi:hypothetical protein